MSRANRGEGTRAVTVQTTTAPNTTTVITSPCRLVGWSFAAGLSSGKYQEGTQTSPGAATTIASLGTVPAGQYTLNWQVELSGTLAGADANNFEVLVGAAVQGVSVNPGAAGLYSQEPIQINVPAGGATVLIQTVGAGTASSVYTAALSITGGTSMEATIFDSGQPIGETAAFQGNSDTQMLSNDGVYVSSNIKVTVTAGTLTGVIYVRDGVEPISA